MNETRPLFILAGNVPYVNRGCEAIVRGTVKILREYFKDPQFICHTLFSSDNQYRKQCQQETDDAIVHLATYLQRPNLMSKRLIQEFWRPDTWNKAYRYYFNKKAYYAQYHKDMLPYLDETVVVLSVGGDLYSLDYGKPTRLTCLDDLVISHHRPLVIWGASVGPFSSMPDYERYMSDHLQKVTGIFAREPATIEYLKSIGVSENVHPVADPAFIMDPIKPEGIDEKMPIEKGSIGINLSSLMSKYVVGGDLNKWARMAASIIDEVAKKTEMQIYLIPHVTKPHLDDYVFMQRALALIQEKNANITLVPPEYNAAETKWIISQMDLFAGARTHSTIAALSSCVPTLSFAYSIKAQGINKAIFDHTDYCLGPCEMDLTLILDRITSMLDDRTNIRRDLVEKMPHTKKAALNAGLKLKQITEQAQ